MCVPVVQHGQMSNLIKVTVCSSFAEKSSSMILSFNDQCQKCKDTILCEERVKVEATNQAVFQLFGDFPKELPSVIQRHCVLSWFQRLAVSRNPTCACMSFSILTFCVEFHDAFKQRISWNMCSESIKIQLFSRHKTNLDLWLFHLADGLLQQNTTGNFHITKIMKNDFPKRQKACWVNHRGNHSQ